MKITELDCDGNRIEETGGGKIVRVRSLRTKRALVGAGARILFYPTLLYNVFRNKIQAEFRWWDQVDQFILLGAVPFPRDVPRLQQLGVRGVITLNEPYETLVPSSLYKEYGIDHLVIPTRDYLFAPSLVDISQAVDFIHKNATCGRTTYVHCKAGRGRSTTIVLCYLVEYKNMTPTAALEYVRSRRPRVLLAPSQWRAVQDYSRRKIEFPAIQSPPPASSPLADALLIEFPASQIPPPTSSPLADAVLVTDADLEGYFTSENYAINRSVSSKVSSLSRSARLSPNSPLDEDEVLVTHEDLEGYVTDEEACKDLSISSFGTHRSKPRRSRLSCLFASLKSTGSSPPEVSRVPEIRAC